MFSATIVEREQQRVRHDGLESQQLAAVQERHREHDRKKQQDRVEHDLQQRVRREPVIEEANHSLLWLIDRRLSLESESPRTESRRPTGAIARDAIVGTAQSVPNALACGRADTNAMFLRTFCTLARAADSRARARRSTAICAPGIASRCNREYSLPIVSADRQSATPIGVAVAMTADRAPFRRSAHASASARSCERVTTPETRSDWPIASARRRRTSRRARAAPPSPGASAHASASA